MIRVGLISDTHGMLRAEAINYLKNADHIIHAGDVGKPEILDTLGSIAPLTVVRGNGDEGTWAAKLPLLARLEFGATRIGVVHELHHFPLEESDIDVLVFGHSHRPEITRRGQTLLVNPGSAGPRRFRLPISAGELLVGAHGVTPRLTTLALDPIASRAGR